MRLKAKKETKMARKKEVRIEKGKKESRLSRLKLIILFPKLIIFLTEHMIQYCTRSME